MKLGGAFEWPVQKEVTEREVRDVMGVMGVSNQITIKSRADITHLGDDIQRAFHPSIFVQP